MSTINKDKLRAEIRHAFEPFRDLIEGTEDDVNRFFERATIAVTDCIAAGDLETAAEVAGGLKALAWSTGVRVKRAHAVVFGRGVLFAIRTALAVMASV